LGPFGGQFAEVARVLLEDIHAGRPVQRRDAVRLARSILESSVVRMAEAVLEADDRQLVPRLVELLVAALEPNVRDRAGRRRFR
jgi:hypothetical protein